MGSGLAGLLLKGMLTESQLFPTSGNLLVLGGTVPPRSARPQKPEHQKYMANIGSSERNKSPPKPLRWYVVELGFHLKLLGIKAHV